MKYGIQHIGRLLKATRLQKGLSQRAFGRMIGIPQSHISKIENGLIDLQTSSLFEISRALGLEPMLIPKALVPAITALQRGLGKEEQIPAYQLEEEEND